MLDPRFVQTTLLIGAVLFSAAVQAEPKPREAALIDLASGKVSRAVARLQKAVRGAAAPDKPALQCLLGRAQRLAKQPAAAISTFEAVPKDAECARRAAFERADALADLGRADEAAAEYARLGAIELGPERDADTVAWIIELADRALTDTQYSIASRLYALALSADVGPTRRQALAARIATAMREAPKATLSVPLSEPLTERLLAEDSPANRRLLAAHLDTIEGHALLAALPPDAATLEAMAATLAGHLDLRLDALDRLAKLGGDAGEQAAKTATLLRLEAGRLGSVDGETAFGDRAASSLRAGLLAQAGERAAARTVIKAHLARFPSDPARAPLTTAWRGLIRQMARQAASQGRFDAALAQYKMLAQADPSDGVAAEVAWASALIERAAGRLDAAEARLRSGIARLKETNTTALLVQLLARIIAFDRNNLAAAKVLLDELKDVNGASDERARFEDTYLAIHTAPQTPGRDARITVHARNLEEVSARLHTVDLEAYMRTGAAPSGLPDLDVAVIAPDRRWSTTVPRFAPAKDVEFDLAIPKPKPGLYMITVSAKTEEASALLWVSKTRIVARMLGPDLAVAVFNGDAPAAKATVKVRSADGKVYTGTTDSTGLYRLTLKAAQSVTILANHRGAPAMLAVDQRNQTLPEPELRMAVEADRPVYRPGDRVGLRIVARKGDAPAQGTFRIWLDGTHRMGETTVKASKYGTIVTELQVPGAGFIEETGRRTIAVMVQGPGEDAPSNVMTVTVAPSSAQMRTVDVLHEGAVAVVQVREADGRPAVGAPVFITADGQPNADKTPRMTDARGQVRVQGPPAMLTWSVRATLGTTDIVAARGRTLSTDGELMIEVDDVPVGASPTLRMQAPDGNYTVYWAAVRSTSKPVALPEDPFIPRFVEGLTGASGALAVDKTRPVYTTRPKSRALVVKNGRAELALADVASGRWRAWVHRTGGLGAAEADFRVGGTEVGLSGVGPARAGAKMAIGLSGPRPALVVAGSDRIMGAAVLTPGAKATWATDARWRNAQVHALDSAGHATSKQAPIDPSLAIDVTTRSEGGTWQISGRVTDGAGAPADAEVSLRIIDERLIDSRMSPQDATLTLFTDLPDRAASAAVFEIVHRVLAEPISAQLLAESRRAQEKKRARQAASGKFGNAFGSVLAEAPLQSQGFGGLGMRGHGRGGGGMGRGGVRAQARLGKSVVRNTRLQGERARVLWAIVPTDKDGRVQVTVPRPGPASRWRLDVVAIGAQARGEVRKPLSTQTDTRMHVVQPGAANPGDQLTARVAVRHGGKTPVTATLTIGDKVSTLTLAPGTGTQVSAGPFAPGAVVPITLKLAGVLIAEQAWRVPVQAGAPDKAGRVLTVAAGPGGAPPTSWLALRGPNVWQTAGQAAAAGRATWAALPTATGAQKIALEARLRATYDALGQLRASGPLDTAAVLHFMADVKERFAVPRGDLEALSGRIGNPGTEATDRLAVLHARVAAGIKVDDSIIARLMRAELADENASRLARVLIALKRADDAKPFVRGPGPQAVIARRALTQSADAKPVLSMPPPPVEAPALADWIRAVARSARSGTGRIDVRIGGTVVGAIDAATGGAVQVVSAGPADVTGLQTISWRSNPTPKGAVDLRTLRLPRDLSGVAARSSEPWPATPSKPTTRLLGLGDVLILDRSPPATWNVPGGFERISGNRLRAVVPGTITLEGLVDARAGAVRPLSVTIQADSPTTGVPKAFALTRAEEARRSGQDPGPWLAPWPTDGDWTKTTLAARRAQVRFDHLLTQEPAPAALVDGFEALREARPTASLGFDAVRRVAEAYRANKVPKRSIAVWRAGLGGAFLTEAGLVRKIEDIGGLVASLEGLRRLAERYPGVPPVAKTTFLLPQRLDELIAQSDLPRVLVKAGVTRADLRLQAAGWDREFLALWPESKVRPEAAFHLVQTLQSLEAHAEAARWGRLLGEQHRDSPIYDGLLYLEGLSRLRLREDGRALKIFERLSTGEFPQTDGSQGPAGTRDDARYALARLYEARGDLEKAKAAYEAAADTHDDAASSAQALKAVRLEADKYLRVKGSSRIELPVRLANITTLNLRAYRLDLRTVFLRDGGLANVHAVKVSGVSPAWSGTIDVPRDPFPKRRTLWLPLPETGAYLVQIEAGGQRAASLVVRTDLSLDAGNDRVRVRLKGKPAAGIGVRTANGEIGVATTDVRGVAKIEGDTVLAFTEDGHVAFTEPAAWTNRPTPSPRRRRPSRSKKKRKSNVQKRFESQIQGNKAAYEQMYNFDDQTIDANLL